MEIDHDQRFKNLIREFFEDFLCLFFANWAERFDFSKIEWLDKEVYADPPRGKRHVLDLVAKLKCKKRIEPSPNPNPKNVLAAVWIEIDSSSTTAKLRPRLCDYYLHLRRTSGLPVLPIAVFLQVGLDGIAVDFVEEKFGELTPIRFEFLRVGLPALDAIEYLEGDNWLGVALTALMRIPQNRIAWLGAEALQKIASAPLTDQKRYLLGECLNAYLPLNDKTREEYEKLLMADSYAKANQMLRTNFDRVFEDGVEKGIEKGIEKGRLEERLSALQSYRNTLIQALEKKFIKVPKPLRSKIERLGWDDVNRLLQCYWEHSSIKDLPID